MSTLAYSIRNKHATFSLLCAKRFTRSLALIAFYYSFSESRQQEQLSYVHLECLKGFVLLVSTTDLLYRQTLP